MPANTDGRTPQHYGGGDRQHWDWAWEQYREAWFVLNVSKYVGRYRTKDGVKDLRKARHYLDKLIELEEREAAARTPPEMRPSRLLVASDPVAAWAELEKLRGSDATRTDEEVAVFLADAARATREAANPVTGSDGGPVPFDPFAPDPFDPSSRVRAERLTLERQLEECPCQYETMCERCEAVVRRLGEVKAALETPSGSAAPPTPVTPVCSGTPSGPVTLGGTVRKGPVPVEVCPNCKKAGYAEDGFLSPRRGLCADCLSNDKDTPIPQPAPNILQEMAAAGVPSAVQDLVAGRARELRGKGKSVVRLCPFTGMPLGEGE